MANKMQLDTCMKKHNTCKKLSIVLPDTEMGNQMTDKCTSVGLLCSVIGHSVEFRQAKWPGNVWEETTERKEWHCNEIKGTKIGKAFAENQQISECFVEASLQPLISQLWSIFWTLCWSTDPQVKAVWMRKEQVNDRCNWSKTQVTIECLVMPAEGWLPT